MGADLSNFFALSGDFEPVQSEFGRNKRRSILNVKRTTTDPTLPQHNDPSPEPLEGRRQS